MQQLKNVLTFAGLEVGVPTALPHGLNHRNGRALMPALVVVSGTGVDATADARHVTVTRQEFGSADVGVYVEAWHTIEGAFPQRPQPFVVRGGSAAKLLFDGHSIIGEGTPGDPLRVNSATTERTLTVACRETDAPGMCVGGTAEAGVTRATPLITGLVTPAIGVITRKFAATLCTVVVFGEVEVTSAPLLPGRPCWVGVDGYPTSTRPVPAPGERIATQAIGVALSEARLLVDPERRPIIATGGLPP